MINFRKSITPGILPVYFYVGRNHQPTYEFYYPSAGSRQLGFGQLPIHPFFADLVQWRQTITSGIEYDWLKNLAPDTNTISLENWIIASFTTVPCRLWWAEQSKHIFYAPVDTYCHRLDPSSMVPVDEDTPILLPDISNSGKWIEYAPPSVVPYIIRKAPLLQDIAAGRSKRKHSSSKKLAPKKWAKGTSSQPDPAAVANLLMSAFQINPAQEPPKTPTGQLMTSDPTITTISSDPPSPIKAKNHHRHQKFPELLRSNYKMSLPLFVRSDCQWTPLLHRI